MLVSFLLLLISTAQADIVKYTDAEGKTHYVDAPEKVPAEYREQLKSQKALPKISRSKPDNKSSSESIYGSSPARKSSTSKSVEIFVTSWCPHCKSLTEFLKAEGIPYRTYDIEKSKTGLRIYKKLGGGGVPVVRIGATVLRGFQPTAIKAALEPSRNAT